MRKGYTVVQALPGTRCSRCRCDLGSEWCRLTERKKYQCLEVRACRIRYDRQQKH